MDSIPMKRSALHSSTDIIFTVSFQFALVSAMSSIQPIETKIDAFVCLFSLLCFLFIRVITLLNFVFAVFHGASTHLSISASDARLVDFSFSTFRTRLPLSVSDPNCVFKLPWIPVKSSSQALETYFVLKLVLILCKYVNNLAFDSISNFLTALIKTDSDVRSPSLTYWFKSFTGDVIIWDYSIHSAVSCGSMKGLDCNFLSCALTNSG